MFKHKPSRMIVYNQQMKLATHVGQVKTKLSKEIKTLYTHGYTVNDVYYDTDENEVYDITKKTLNTAYPRQNLLYYAYLHANGKTVYDVYYDDFYE